MGLAASSPQVGVSKLKFLITGGLGFIGSNLVKYIIENYPTAEVINVDSITYGANPENLREYEGHPRYKFIKGDITDYKLILKTISDVDAIINLAAQTHVDRSISNPQIFFESNTMGVFTILEAMRRKNVEARLVHVSTDEVYGSIQNGSFHENDRLNPSSPYSATKAAADMLVIAYHKTYGLNAIITRCTNNFGPYQFPEKLIPKSIIRASLNLQIPIYGTGNQVRDWIYVEDHCRALLHVLEHGEKGEIYNISSGNEIENIRLVKMILEIMNKPESLIKFVEDRPAHDVRYSLDSQKIRRLGWKPKYDFKNALRATVDWYLKNEWWWKPIADERVLHPTPWRLSW